MPNMDKETHFVMRNGKAEYPSVAQEDLLAWYDAKGKHNPDRHKDTLLDLSGNNRHAELYNFAYEKKSGYLDNPEGGLLFDDVDDKLIYPSVKDEVEYTSASRNLIREIKASGDVTIAFDGNTFVFSKTDGKNGIIGRGTDNLGLNQFSSNTQYTLSGYFEVVTGGFYFGFHYTDGTMKYNRLVTGTNFSFSTESGKTLAYISWYVDLYQYSGKITNFQLEEGSIATPYTPYVPLPVMTYQYNGNILSYEADGTVKRVDDGKVIERKGINLVRNGNGSGGVSGWIGYYGNVYADENELVFTLTDLSNPSSRLQALGFNYLDYASGHKYYFSGEIKAPGTSPTFIQFDNLTADTVYTTPNQWMKVENILTTALQNGKAPFRFYHRSTGYAIGEQWRYRNIQAINLTEAYGVGNEPTLEYIQAHPEEFAWTPNPNDLIEAHEFKNNLVGDLEDLHGAGDKTEILSGVGEVFTDKADDNSIVHVELEGKSVQPHRFREESGESLVLTNHAEDKPRKLEVLGNTFQNAGSGKNLFNFNSITRTVNSSLLITEVESNGFTVESTNTTSWQTIVWELDSVLEPNKTYTIKFPFKLLSGNITDSYAQFSLDRKLIGNLVERTDSFIGTFQTGELIKGVSKLTINFHINGISNVVLKKVQFYNIQLEEGPTATAYEPPAPSPDYPIEMKSVGEGLELYGGIGGRNLARSSLINHLPSKMIDGEDYWVVKGISSGNASSITLKDMFKENTQYTFQFLGIATTYFNMFRINYADGGVSTVKTFKSGSLDSITSDPNRTIKFITIDTGSTAAEGYVRKNTFKIEEGSTATPYTPAPEDVPLNTTQNGVFRTKPNLTAPLRKVGDVADRLFWDATAEKWKVERRVGYQEFDGTENWRHQVQDNGYWMAIQGRAELSRLLVSNSFTSSGGKIGMMQSGAATNVLFYYDEGVGGTKGWKAYLAERKSQNNPLNLMYNLKTPVTETLEGGQLPPLFSPTTYLDTTSEVKGQLTAGYRLKEGVEPEDSDVLVAPEYVNPIHSLNDFDVVSSVGYNNQFLNTDFKNGLTHWSLSNADGGYQDNEGWSIANGRYTGLRQNIPHYESLKGHVLYGRVELKSDSQSSYFVFFNDGFGQVTRSVPPSTFGEFTALSAMSTINDEARHIYCRIQDARTEGWTETRIRNLYVLDLTEIYGKGNEPTQAEMDVLFKDKWAPSIFDITEDGSSHPSINKANILLSEPLRSVGDVKDRLFRDSDGLWKIERNVGQEILNGNTNLQTTGAESYDAPLSTSRWVIPSRLMSGSASGNFELCSHLPHVDYVWSLAHFPEGTSVNSSNQFHLRFLNNTVGITSSDNQTARSQKIKSYFAEQLAKGTPVTIQYQLKTPYNETLPQSDQDKLNNIATYAGSNYVYTVLPDKDAALAEQLQPTIHAKFRKLSWFWSRLLFNQLKIWKRNLTDSELVHEWKQNKKRWGM